MDSVLSLLHPRLFLWLDSRGVERFHSPGPTIRGSSISLWLTPSPTSLPFPFLDPFHVPLIYPDTVHQPPTHIPPSPPLRIEISSPFPSTPFPPWDRDLPVEVSMKEEGKELTRGQNRAALSATIAHVFGGAMQRVKVYKLLSSGTWEDRGTGHAKVEFMQVRTAVPTRCGRQAGPHDTKHVRRRGGMHELTDGARVDARGAERRGVRTRRHLRNRQPTPARAPNPAHRQLLAAERCVVDRTKRRTIANEAVESEKRRLT